MTMNKKIKLKEKNDKLTELYKLQCLYLKKIKRITSYKTPKKTKTMFNRCIKSIMYACAIKEIQIQKQIIKSQHIYDFKKGGIINGSNHKVEIDDNEKILPVIRLNKKLLKNK